MNILVIGGTNFIGLHTANEFIANGHNVTVFHRNPYTGSALSGQVKHILGNRHNLSELSEAIRAVSPDMIIDAYAMNENEVKILEAALSKRTRVVILSSADVYEAYSVLSAPGAEPQHTPLAENAALREKLFPYRGVLETAFAHDYDKILVERAAQGSSKMDAVIVRLGMIYGENDSQHRFLRCMEQMKQEKAIVMSKDMANWKTSKGYVKNIAYGIYLAAMKGQAGEIYNLAEQHPVSEYEWYKRVAEMLLWNGTIELRENDESGANWKQDLTMDTGKIRAALGYTEKYSVEQALKNTLDWEEENCQR